MQILNKKCRFVIGGGGGGGAENCISPKYLCWVFWPPLKSKLIDIDNGDHGYQNSETCSQFTSIDL